MPRPKHPKPDRNQAEIIAQCHQAGFVVCNVSSLPVALAGIDDYIYGYNLLTKRVECKPFEIKMPGEDLNDNEREFFAKIAALGPGGDDVLHIAREFEDVLREFGRI